ncbi:TPA: hypothetical protein OT890_002387 [Raoultella ornithinolytica]|nr:hypothetical protein [Raoultella ornithinolytica]
MHGAQSCGDVQALIAVAARGYAFPTNLDTDPPLGGMVPKTQQALVREALANRWDEEPFTRALDEHTARRQG